MNARPGVEKLVADPGFLRYHAEYAKRRKFNAFDVLRYAEYEIRHSNVMAWLLDPRETHGIGREFLEWFLGEVKFPRKTGLPGTIIRGDGGQTVRVERERHYVDVMITLESDQGRWIVAIENKPGWAARGHYDQIRGYNDVLRKEYKGHSIRNVLLSASREGIEDEREIAHVSWRDVRAQVEKMHDAGAFGERAVAAFIRQYLAAVARMIGPEERDANYFRKLLDDHHSLLKDMSGVLGDEGGDHKVREMVPDPHADYRDTVVRLAKDFGQEPTRLRNAVREMFTSRGIKTAMLGQWLNWDLEAAQALGTTGCFRWQLAFRYRQITVLLEIRSHCRKALKDLLAFVRETPIDRSRRDRYPMRPKDFGFFNVYYHELVGDDVLSGRSTTAVTEAVRQAVVEFLDSEDSDYTRINDYFRCLAFRPDATSKAVEDARRADA